MARTAGREVCVVCAKRINHPVVSLLLWRESAVCSGVFLSGAFSACVILAAVKLSVFAFR